MKRTARISVLVGLVSWLVLGLLGCNKDSEPPSKKAQLESAPTTNPADRDTSLIILVADVWPPYNCAPDDPNEGYMVDVAREIFEPLGYRVEYRVVPWPRALAGALDGSYDGAVGAVRSEGPELVFPEQELLLNTVAFFTRAGDPWRFTGEASLASVRLGAAQSYKYIDWLDDYILRNHENPDKVQVIAGYDPLEQNLQKLIDKQIDVLVDNQDTILYKARQMGWTDKIQLAGLDPLPIPCFIGFSPNTRNGRHLALTLDEGLQRLRASGKFAEILKPYGLTDWVLLKEK